MTDYAKEPQPKRDPYAGPGGCRHLDPTHAEPQPAAPAMWTCVLHRASGHSLTGCPDCLSEALLIATQALSEIIVMPGPFYPLRPKEIADAAMTKLLTISVRS